MPVFWSRSAGANKSGFGRGSPVRCGLVFIAAVMAGADEGGQIRVISKGRVSRRCAA